MRRFGSGGPKRNAQGRRIGPTALNSFSRNLLLPPNSHGKPKWLRGGREGDRSAEVTGEVTERGGVRMLGD